MPLAAVAAVFGACGLYLGVAGVLLLVRPGVIPLAYAAPLLSGLETSGPYMFLLAAVVAGVIGWGLQRRVNLARRAAIVVAAAGIAALVPSVSGAAMMVQPRALVLGGFGVIVRVVVAFSLMRGEVAEEFR